MDDNALSADSFDANTRTAAFTADGLHYLVEGILLSPAGVKAKVTISKDGAPLARDLIALASDAARRKLARQVPGHDEGEIGAALMQVEDAVLALAPKLAENGHTYPSYIAGTPSEVVSSSDTGESAPVTLTEVEGTFRKWLLMPDPSALHFVLSVLAAHHLGGDPVWGLVVAPPAGSKTEIIRALEGVRGIYPLSELTARTFASGLEAGGREPSLLPRLKDHVLTLKDFTTVLTMYRDERQAILAQLREIYDGRYDKTWGTGKELHWQGRLGFIAGVTPIIDQHHAVHHVLGERFVLFRPDQPDRHTMGLRAIKGRGQEAAMRAELRDVVARFVSGLDLSDTPTLPPAFVDRLATLADFVSAARSGIVRDRYSREMVLAPVPEGPARLAKVLASLTVAHAVIRGSGKVDMVDYALAFNVGLDSLPAVRRRVAEVLFAADDYLNTSQAAAAIRYPTTTARRTLEDLAALKVVAVSKAETQGKADNWQLTESARAALCEVRWTLFAESGLDTEEGTFPAMQEGYVGLENGEPVAASIPADLGTDPWRGGEA